MARNTLSVVLLAVFAGATAGMAVQFFFGTGDSASGSASSSADRAPSEEAGLAADLEDLRLEVNDLRQKNAEMELALSDASIRIEAVKTDFAKAVEENGALAAANKVSPMVFGSPNMKVMGTPQPGVRATGSTWSFGGGGKGFELLRLPEEERWEKLREELSLDSYQESELKRIRDDLRAGLKDNFKVDPATGEMSGKLDIAKMLGERQKAADRVKNLLTEEQHEKYKKEGYGAAIGLGSSAVAVSVSSESIPIHPRGK